MPKLTLEQANAKSEATQIHDHVAELRAGIRCDLESDIQQEEACEEAKSIDVLSGALASSQGKQVDEPVGLDVPALSAPASTRGNVPKLTLYDVLSLPLSSSQVKQVDEPVGLDVPTLSGVSASSQGQQVNEPDGLGNFEPDWNPTDSDTEETVGGPTGGDTQSAVPSVPSLPPVRAVCRVGHCWVFSETEAIRGLESLMTVRNELLREADLTPRDFLPFHLQKKRPGSNGISMGGLERRETNPKNARISAAW